MPMTEPTIKCPQCNIEIKLTESLAAPLLESTRKQFEQQIAQKDEFIAKREQSVREKEKQLADAKKSIEDEVANKVSEQLRLDRAKIAAEETKKAKLAVATDLDQKTKELADLQEVLAQRDAKLAEAQKMQAEILKKQRVLEDKERELDLTIEKKIQEGIGAVRNQAKAEATEESKLKLAEKEKTITDLQKNIEEWKRKAEQGSQQLQGEVQELELETLLKSKFPFDSIEPVPKGEFGGDALHRVIHSNGQSCGTIIWESKRTKNWSDGWLTKLRDDQRSAKAEIAIIVSQVLPKGVETFDIVEGVWVVHPRAIIPVASILRSSLIEIATAKQVGQGLQTKTELLYQYLTGTRFRQRVEAIVEAFTTMKEDLDKERKVITAQWSKRETQIENVMNSTVGMYGDLQGIAGKSLVEIEGLEMRVLGYRD